MVIDDKIYGKIRVDSKLIIDLVHSKPLRRLRGISQDGAPHYIQPVRNVNKLEHSLGVWYLSKKFRRSTEEQIACLLHDIPHTAFSHVVDFVMKDKGQEYHDKFLRKIVYKSEIPSILEKHGLALEKVLSDDSPLLKNKLPDVSFDRLDYFLRDGYSMKFLPKKTIDMFLKGLSVVGDKLVFSAVEEASLMAILFTSFSRLIWLDPTSHGSFFLLSEALKIGLKKGAITEEDLFRTDRVVMNKLRRTKDKDISILLDRLQKGKEFVYAPKKDSEFYGQNKPRSVDPFVKIGSRLQRVGTLVPSIGYYIDEFTEKYKEIGVRQL